MARSPEAVARAKHNYAERVKERNRSRDVYAEEPPKQCPECERTLPAEAFYLDISRPNGLGRLCRLCNSIVSKRTHAARRDERNHARRLAKFNLTQEQFEALGTACMICGVEDGDPRCGQWGKLLIDHDHRCCPGTGSCGACVRGLLCENCNKGIGNLGDESERLFAAAWYLMERGV